MVRQILAEAQPWPYTRTLPTPTPVLGAFHSIIDTILADDEVCRDRTHAPIHGYSGVLSKRSRGRSVNSIQAVSATPAVLFVPLGPPKSSPRGA